MLLMVATTIFTLTSCEWIWNDDHEIANTLEGTWRGNMEISSSYDGRDYYTTRTEITFLRDPYEYSSGDGYWVDFYSNAPWGDYVANHISWQVRNNRIYVYFREEGSELIISDYRLYEDRFTGTLWDNDNHVYFEMYHTSSPNWGIYRYGFDDYYWSRPTRSEGSDTIHIEKPTRHVGKAGK